MMTTTLEVSQEILDSARLTISEIKVELAVHLYEQRRLSIGKARELADMSLWAFRQLRAESRYISMNQIWKQISPVSKRSSNCDSCQQYLAAYQPCGDWSF